MQLPPLQMDLKKYPNLQLPQLKFLAKASAGAQQIGALHKLRELIELDGAND
jgi:hypothetical protein